MTRCLNLYLTQQGPVFVGIYVELEKEEKAWDFNAIAMQNKSPPDPTFLKVQSGFMDPTICPPNLALQARPRKQTVQCSAVQCSPVRCKGIE